MKLITNLEKKNASGVLNAFWSPIKLGEFGHEHQRIKIYTGNEHKFWLTKWGWHPQNTSKILTKKRSATDHSEVRYKHNI